MELCWKFIGILNELHLKSKQHSDHLVQARQRWIRYTIRQKTIFIPIGIQFWLSKITHSIVLRLLGIRFCLPIHYHTSHSKNNGKIFNDARTIWYSSEILIAERKGRQMNIRVWRKITPFKPEIINKIIRPKALDANQDAVTTKQARFSPSNWQPFHTSNASSATLQASAINLISEQKSLMVGLLFRTGPLIKRKGALELRNKLARTN